MHNCYFTRNASYLASPGDFDMVMFLGKENLKQCYDEVKDTRTADQIYTLVLTEPPHLVPNLAFLDNSINWTISYRLDADIRWDSYGYVVDRTTKEIVAPAYHPEWRPYEPGKINASFFNQSGIREIASGKNKSVAWFVSNCAFTTSERLKLAKEMQKYLPVDIYGKCGSLKCPQGTDKCWKMLDRDYKFYLSFENSLCDDYLTEKATRQMISSRIIPVLYNGAEVNRFLPPHSYIDVRDFKSVKELTDYLIFLEHNLEEYLSYFWWKEYYEVIIARSYCKTCQKLNLMNRKRPNTAYPDLEKWYKKDRCRKPTLV